MRFVEVIKMLKCYDCADKTKSMKQWVFALSVEKASAWSTSSR